MAKKDYLKSVYGVIAQADILLEILDARFFEETRNKEIEKYIAEQGKKLIYVFNKIDLVNLHELKQKTEHLYPRVFVSCSQRKGRQELRERIMMTAKELPYEKVFAGIIGYPNTGKSSLINLLRGKGVARASPESGFTKGIQKIRVSSTLILIDTPGVIPQKQYSPSPEEKKLVAYAKVGARMYDKVKDPELIIADLWIHHQAVLEKFYQVSGEDALAFLEHVAKKMHFLLKGGRYDLDRASRLVLRDWQKGKIVLK